jgi:hypothetical protein
MISTGDLARIARARLADAKALRSKRRYDGAIYLCGYAVEVALKARICKTLKWPGLPETQKEFSAFKTFHIHDLDVLLTFSGVEDRVKTAYLAEWSVVRTWGPESRYKIPGSATLADANNMLKAVQTLIKVLL